MFDSTTEAMDCCILPNALGGAKRNANDDEGIDSGGSGECGDCEWDAGVHDATNPGGDEGGSGVLYRRERRANRIYLFRYDGFVATAGGGGTFLSGVQCTNRGEPSHERAGPGGVCGGDGARREELRP